MTKQVWIALLLMVICAGPVRAQTITQGPLTTANKIVWDMDNEASAASAAGLTYRMRVDQPISGPFTALAGVTCVAYVPATANKWTCTASVPQAVATATTVRGSHSLTLTAFDGTSESGASLPFVLPTPPAVPSSLRAVP